MKKPFRRDVHPSEKKFAVNSRNEEQNEDTPDYKISGRKEYGVPECPARKTGAGDTEYLSYHARLASRLPQSFTGDESVCEDGQYDRLEEYLGLLEQDLDHVNQLIETGNVNLDAILNSKISLAQKNGIAIDYQAKCPETLAVSDIDLCALIGNLLDNAVESCEKLTAEKPFIRLYIGVLKKQLYISVSNATNETVRKMDSEYISKKRGNHGHGLKRINLVVEKYGGYINRQNEPGVFVTEIMLPL